MWQGFLRWLRSLGFSIAEAFVNLQRHRLMTAAAITTIAVTLILIGSFALAFFQMHTAIDRAAGEFEMHVFCRETVKKDDIPELQKRISALPGVAKVIYITKEEAYKAYTADLPMDTEGIPNTFSEEFQVTFTDAKAAPNVAATVRGWHGEVQEVALPEREMSGVFADSGLFANAWPCYWGSSVVWRTCRRVEYDSVIRL